MLNPDKYDFSRESGLKKRLFPDVKKEYEKARRQTELSDDDLERVVAAGAGDDAGLCPLPNQSCQTCDKYSLGICRLGYTKVGGN